MLSVTIRAYRSLRYAARNRFPVDTAFVFRRDVGVTQAAGFRNRRSKRRGFCPQRVMRDTVAGTAFRRRRVVGSRMGEIMAHWSNELRIDPVVWATALFGVVTAAILVTAI